MSNPGGLTDHQLRNLVGIIDAVKAKDLPVQAAHIVVMACLTESQMQMYANANVPTSVNYPYVPISWEPDGLGHDHASIGMLQQQVGPSYALPGTSTVDDNTWGTPAQLMDPQYSATQFLNRLVAFDWASMAPWLAAQQVQISAFADGSNYEVEYNRAVSLVDALWTGTSYIPTPPPAWVAWGGASSLIADTGPYFGAWPPPIPDPALLPVDAGQLDYYVGLPNPDGDPAHFADGSYPCLYWHTFLGWNGTPGDRGDVYSDSQKVIVGAVTDPNAQPAGAHLFIGWSDLNFDAAPDTPAPSVEPAALLPSPVNTINGGTTGYWSDWITPAPVLLAAELSFETLISTSSEADTTIDSDTDIAPMVQQGYLDALAGVATLSPLPGVLSAEVAATAEKANFDQHSFVLGDPVTGSSTSTAVTVQQSLQTWDAAIAMAALAPDPDPLTGLVLGVDYTAIPGTAVTDPYRYVQYEAADTSLIGWQDLAATTMVACQLVPKAVNNDGTAADVPTNFVYPASMTWRAALVDAAGWALPGDGDQLANLSFAVQDDGQADTFTPRPFPVNLPLSRVTGGSAAILQQVYLPDGQAPGGNFHAYSTPGEHVWIYEAAWAWSGGAVADLRAAPPSVLVQPPRYRYWHAGAPPVVLPPVVPPPGPVGETPYLRLTQRDDGYGVARHARLNVASDTANQPSSVQHSRAPRIGGANRYA